MSTAFPSRGLYAITPEGLHGDALARACGLVLAGGAAVLQYRDKGAEGAVRRDDARRLRDLTHRHHVPLIINDDVELAATTAADGVHLGREDAEPGAARALLGPGAIIGVSCYDQPERAAALQERGADYVAFGRFFASGSKPAATAAGPATLAAARPRLRVPVVAIGGIKPENGALLLAAGADLLAVIGALFHAPDPRAAAAAFARLFEPASTPPTT